MTPLLTGVFASQISGHLTPAFTPTGSYESLATYTVPSGGLSSITFSGLPTDGQYKNLELRWWAPSSISAGDSFCLQFGNGSIDSGNNYSYHGMYGYNGGGVYGGVQNLNQARAEIHYSSNTDTIGTPFTGIVSILDYSSNVKKKSLRSLSGHQHTSGSSGNYSQVWYYSGIWNSTNPINTVRFFFGGGNLPQYTKVSLYGLKG